MYSLFINIPSQNFAWKFSRSLSCNLDFHFHLAVSSHFVKLVTTFLPVTPQTYQLRVYCLFVSPPAPKTVSGKIKFETNQFQTQHFQVLFKTHKKQEFIKIGCVPPASVAISGAGGCLPEGDLPRGCVCLP